MAERGVLVPEDIQAGLEPQLRPDLTRAQLLRVEELREEFETRKGVREEAKRQRKEAKEALEAAKKAFEEADQEWMAADNAVKASSLERRQYYVPQ
jgi:phage-related tail protein